MRELITGSRNHQQTCALRWQVRASDQALLWVLPLACTRATLHGSSAVCKGTATMALVRHFIEWLHKYPYGLRLSITLMDVLSIAVERVYTFMWHGQMWAGHFQNGRKLSGARAAVNK